MSERWHTIEVGPDSFMIMEGDYVRGAIMREGNHLHAAIMGDTTDISGDFQKYEAALAFVEGIEKTLLTLNAGLP